VSRRTQDPVPRRALASRTGLSPALAGLPRTVPLTSAFLTARGGSDPLRTALTTPRTQRSDACTHAVWAPPPSLAATRGISLDFFSWRYWDGSVPAVLLRAVFYSCADANHPD